MPDTPVTGQAEATRALAAIADPVVRRLVEHVVGSILLQLAVDKPRPLAPLDLPFLVNALAGALRDPNLIVAIALGDIDAGSPWSEGTEGVI